MPNEQVTPIWATWDAIASGYDEFATPMAVPLAEEVLEVAGLRPGTYLLDVASGTGALAISAARRGARVLAVDIAPAMIARLRDRVRAEGVEGVEARVMDGCALDLDDDTFDVTASQNGVSLFPDMTRALAELVRVTKPEGRVVITAFGPPQRVEFVGMFMAAIQAAAPELAGPPPEPGADHAGQPDPFRLADPDTLRSALSEAGLNGVTIKTVDWRMEFRSVDHFCDIIANSNPIGANLISQLSPEQATTVRGVLAGMLRERSGGGPTVLTAQMHIGIGTK